MVFGVDREMADRYIANERKVILKGFRGAYQKMKIVEGFS